MPPAVRKKKSSELLSSRKAASLASAPSAVPTQTPALRPAFRCDIPACEQVSLVWLPKCPQCGLFNTFNTPATSADYVPRKSNPDDDDASNSLDPNPNSSDPADHSTDPALKKKDEKALFTPLGEIDDIEPPRIPTGDGGIDHVLGGGVVVGSFVMMSGAPGSGKSTLSLSTGARIAHHFPVWYAIGEHGKERIRRMSNRLKLHKLAKGSLSNMTVLDEISKDTDLLCKHLKSKKPFDPSKKPSGKPGDRMSDYTPVLCVIDSLMSIRSEEHSSGAAGSPSQVKYAVDQLKTVAEDTGMGIIGIAHVTNDGSFAGPSQAKHWVDTLLMLEHVKLMVDKDDGTLEFKVIPRRIPGKPSFLRLAAMTKNRDGDVSACAFYRMTAEGLQLIALADEEKLEWEEDPYALLARQTGRSDTQVKPGKKAPKEDRHARKRTSASAEDEASEGESPCARSVGLLRARKSLQVSVGTHGPKAGAKARKPARRANQGHAPARARRKAR